MQVWQMCKKRKKIRKLANTFTQHCLSANIDLVEYHRPVGKHYEIF